MMGAIDHFWRTFRWWLFSKNELAQLIRGLQGQIGFCHREIDSLKAKLARYEQAVTRDGGQHYVELRDCALYAEERTKPDTGQPFTMIMVQPKTGGADPQRIHHITIYGPEPAPEW